MKAIITEEEPNTQSGVIDLGRIFNDTGESIVIGKKFLICWRDRRENGPSREHLASAAAGCDNRRDIGDEKKIFRNNNPTCVVTCVVSYKQNYRGTSSRDNVLRRGRETYNLEHLYNTARSPLLHHALSDWGHVRMLEPDLAPMLIQAVARCPGSLTMPPLTWGGGLPLVRSHSGSTISRRRNVSRYNAIYQSLFFVRRAVKVVENRANSGRRRRRRRGQSFSEERNPLWSWLRIQNTDRDTRAGSTNV